MLIGPNGSGKSNLLEFLNQVFKSASTTRCKINHGLLASLARSEQVDDPRTILQLEHRTFRALEPNRKHANAPSTAKITVELSEADKRNLTFLRKQAKDINRILDRFTNYSKRLPEQCPDQIADLFTADLFVEVQKSQRLEISCRAVGDLGVLLGFYLAEFDLLAAALLIHNQIAPGELWPFPEQTFAFFGGARTNVSVEGSTQPTKSLAEARGELANRFRDEEVRQLSGASAAVYELIKSKLGFMFTDQIYSASPRAQGAHEALKTILESGFVSEMNSLLAKYVGVQLVVRLGPSRDNQLHFHVSDAQTGERVSPQHLSSGQRSLAHLVFSLFGYDLDNGIVVIDEPELHLHPQWQKSYLDILESFATKHGLQAIIATHSPVFVTEDNLKFLCRCSIGTTGYSTILPVKDIEVDRTTVRTIDYTNAAKVFFAKKVVLVEGDTDEYFLRHLSRHLSRLDNQLADGLREVEFLNIAGKGGRANYVRVMARLGVEHYFIGDWDSIDQFIHIDFHSISAAASEALVQAGRGLESKGSRDMKALLNAVNDVIARPGDDSIEELKYSRDYILRRHVDWQAVRSHLISNQPDRYSQVLTEIERLKTQGVFILCQGELEDYLGIHHDGLATMIDFCKSRFADWFDDPAYSEKRAEIVACLKHIVSASVVTP